jgi:hypothetical protein
MKLRFKLGVGIALLVVSLAMGNLTFRANPQTAQPSVLDAAVLFTTLRPTLEQGSVPLRLPTYIPANGQRLLPNPDAPSLQVYAVLDNVQPDQGYQITLGYTSDCSGGNACRLGTIAGAVKPHQSIQETYAFMRDPNFKGRRSQEVMAPVTLSKEIQGWFIPWICGANCNDAQVVWEENIYRYSVGIKVGDKASLVKMANSAIEAAQR